MIICLQASSWHVARELRTRSPRSSIHLGRFTVWIIPGFNGPGARRRTAPSADSDPLRDPAGAKPLKDTLIKKLLSLKAATTSVIGPHLVCSAECGHKTQSVLTATTPYAFSPYQPCLGQTVCVNEFREGAVNPKPRQHTAGLTKGRRRQIAHTYVSSRAKGKRTHHVASCASIRFPVASMCWIISWAIGEQGRTPWLLTGVHSKKYCNFWSPFAYWVPGKDDGRDEWQRDSLSAFWISSSLNTQSAFYCYLWLANFDCLEHNLNL